MTGRFTSGGDAQRVEAVVRAIAHELNNDLAVILVYTTSAARKAADDATLCEDLEEIRTAAEHAAELADRLMLFSRAHR